MTTGTVRSSAGLETRRRRALYRAWHRGTREMDLVIGRFADAYIETLAEEELDAFELLLEAPDPDLAAWLIEGHPTPKDYDTGLLRKLKHFHQSRTTPLT